MAKITRVLNQEMYNMFRNTQCFVTRRREVIICKLLAEKNQKKSRTKLNAIDIRNADLSK
jgi:hypothetical protein